MTMYTLHIILVLRVYALYGSKILVCAFACVMLLALGIDIYIVVVLEPPSQTVFVPGVGVQCLPGGGTAFGLIWYAT